MNRQLIRPAVRGLVIDHDDCVLMVKLVFPQGTWWVLPGGGIDEGEGYVIANLDFDELERVRADLPALEHRRPDLFPVSSGGAA